MGLDRLTILRQLRLLLSDRLSFLDFVHWFNAALWAADAGDDDELADIAWSIDAKLYDRSKGVLDEQELREALMTIAVVMERQLPRQSPSNILQYTKKDVKEFGDGALSANELSERLHHAISALHRGSDPSGKGDAAEEIHATLLSKLITSLDDQKPHSEVAQSLVLLIPGTMESRNQLAMSGPRSRTFAPIGVLHLYRVPAGSG